MYASVSVRSKKNAVLKEKLVHNEAIDSYKL